jgi:hypothetical protein
LKFFLITLSLLFLLPPAVYSQVDVTGRITDESNGETLPSAAIILDGTYRGTISNSEGFFTITVDSLPVALTVRFLGFRQEKITVTEESELPLLVTLSPSITEMGEIVVTDKDPGLTIMEMVIERKKIWRQTLQNYKVSAYTRQSISNDTSIVSISESSSTAYWDENRGHKEVQLSQKQTTNISGDQNFSGVRYMPNFYDDNVEVAGYNIVGITHPDATQFYNFTLVETQEFDSKPLYKIEFTPRKKLQPTFIGTAWVLGRDYALLEVDLKPNEVVDFPPPVQEFDLSYRQQFSNYGGSFWLPVDMRIEGRVKIGMIGFRMPAVQFKQVSTLSGYEVNTAIPDSVFRDTDDFARIDDVKMDSLYTDIERIPLTEEESLAYSTIDSTDTIEKAFQAEGFLARAMENSDERERSGLFSSVAEILPGGLSPALRYNRMDGFHAGLRYKTNLFDGKSSLSGFGGFSFNSSFWDYGARLRQEIVEAGKTTLYADVDFAVETESRYPSLLYSLGLNSFATVIGGVDYFDYFRKESISAGLGFEEILPKTDVSVSFNHEIHRSFDDEGRQDYSLFGWHDDRRKNPEIDDGKLQSLVFSTSINKQQNTFGVTGRRQLLIEIEWSDETLGSDFNFVNYRASVDWNMHTFFKRRVFANTLDVHLSGGLSQGTVPIQRFGAIDGSMNHFTPFGSLRTRQFLPYEGTRHWLAVAEHNFRTIPFEWMRLQWLADRGWGIIVFGGAGHTYADRNLYDGRMLTNGMHTEAGISLNSIFGILRVDFAKRLDRPGTFIGVSVPRYF